ncbi:MAG: outer membrane beta-barrel protein, partial [Bacteroidetes bacterium]|nr:outer membrane beta-barrel protein [Bacteroidota bacterium]
MKKIITLVIAGFVSLSVFAQNDLVPRIGLKGGLNIATIINTNDNSFSSKALFGFNGGAVLQLPLTKYIAIQPEVLFSQKGYHATGSSFLGDYDYRRYLNF